MAMAYPLASRFRTGTTLAMFTLVVFTLVTGTASSGSFIRASRTWSATAAGSTCARGRRGSRRSTTCVRRSLGRPAHGAGDFTCRRQPVVSAGGRAPAGHQQGRRAVPAPRASTRPSSAPRRSDWARSRADTPRRAEVWRAIAEHPGLAVVDSFVVPRRDNFNFVDAHRLPAQRVLLRGWRL